MTAGRMGYGRRGEGDAPGDISRPGTAGGYRRDLLILKETKSAFLGAEALLLFGNFNQDQKVLVDQQLLVG